MCVSTMKVYSHGKAVVYRVSRQDTFYNQSSKQVSRVGDQLMPPIYASFEKKNHEQTHTPLVATVVTFDEHYLDLQRGEPGDYNRELGA